jgi:DNA mismatch endonuclease, patch repair protein
MRSNRGRTAPERKFASHLWRNGLRYLTSDGYSRVHGVRIEGKPDLVFRGARTLVFVDGCFWHGCQTCDRGFQTLSTVWQAKISANRRRDLAVNSALAGAGWLVLRVPEHAIRTKALMDQTALAVMVHLI